MRLRALVIDDDVSTLELMQFQLEREGFETAVCESGQKALKIVEEKEFDIILTDLNLPDADGIEIVRHFKQVTPDTEIIMVTGFGSMEKAIEATKAGAFYYVEKPVNFGELRVLIEKAVERKQHTKEIKELRGRLTSRSSFEGIIGASRTMQNIYEIIESVADSDANILILGESGTGKEVIANAIHYKSLRAKKSFVKVNCSALPKDLIESQLFGHTKGAFTGATGEKTGFIGQANGGSLLLDEIAEMPIELQPKLLRVLQERVYYRVGSDTPQEVDFRLISATNRDPLTAIAEGSLREDLYYRINTIEIKIPPLRDRMEDIPMLAEHFLKIFAEKYKRAAMKFSQSCYNQMLNYHWRGNVRELQNVIERTVLLSRTDTITELHIAGISEKAFPADNRKATVTIPVENDPDMNFADGLSNEKFFEEVSKLIVEKLPEPTEGKETKDIFDQLEAYIVRAALRRTKGNKQAASHLLGLYRPRLYGIIKRHCLEEKD
jgi:DNA-binding NtrC family response regulator